MCSTLRMKDSQYKVAFIEVNRACELSMVSRTSFDFEDAETDRLLGAVYRVHERC